MMDCRTTQLLLTFARPKASELGPCEEEAVNNHLAACSECAALARSDAVGMARVGVKVDHRIVVHEAESRADHAR